jgi:hypothetical protein
MCIEGAEGRGERGETARRKKGSRALVPMPVLVLGAQAPPAFLRAWCYTVSL